MTLPELDGIVGLLLAGGRGTRFDSSGRRNKLLAPLPDGRTVLRASATALCDVLPQVVVVVREGSQDQIDALIGLPVQIVENRRAALGMGTSIAAGVAATAAARGWLVALADMPYLASMTIAAVALRVAQDDRAIVAPTLNGQRGHPVGFGNAFGPALIELRGDQGPRALFEAHPVSLLPVLDSGILRDIDTPGDLEPEDP